MKYFFKRVLPAPEKLRKGRILGPLLKRIGNPRIWMVNRRSIAGGVAAGLFFGSLPIPIQIPCAVCVAVMMRFNAPVAAFATLFSNPITMPAIFYFNYRIGIWLFNHCYGYTAVSHVKITRDSLLNMGGHILVPLYSGSIIVGIILAVLGYTIVLTSWRWSLINHRKQRLERNFLTTSQKCKYRKNFKQNNESPSKK